MAASPAHTHGRFDGGAPCVVRALAHLLPPHTWCRHSHTWHRHSHTCHRHMPAAATLAHLLPPHTWCRHSHTCCRHSHTCCRHSHTCCRHTGTPAAATHLAPPHACCLISPPPTGPHAHIGWGHMGVAQSGTILWGMRHQAALPPHTAPWFGG